MMKPFANETDTFAVGELTIENRTDRVQLYGSVHLTKDKEGLKKAMALKELIDNTIAQLNEMDLPEQITEKATSKIRNPFK